MAGIRIFRTPSPRRMLVHASMVAWLLGAALVGVTGAQAQDATRIPRGSRVRIRRPAPIDSSLVGTVVSADAESLVLETRPGRVLVSLPAACVTSLERSLGRPSRRGLDAGIGFVMGACAGALIGSRQQPDFVFSRRDKTIFSACIFGLAGATFGALAGSIDPGEERWEPIVPPRVRVALASGRIGTPLAVDVTLRF